ncbi:MAG: hypothetical protein ACO2OY_10605 [Thermodesulfobacteriaceae bacterium]|jgi:phenylacetate-coenzyme A ligase PaaK-like adenylate-forming protein
MSGAGPGDIFQNSMTYGFFTWALVMHYVAYLAGLSFIPARPGNNWSMHLKIDSTLGRTDDVFIIREVNITPQHLKAELMRFPEVGQSYQIVLEGYHELIVKVELNNIFHYTIIKHRG